jgi:hypothetical protein
VGCLPKYWVPPTIAAVGASLDGQDWSPWLHFAYILPPQGPALPPPFPFPPPPAVDPMASLPINTMAGDIKIISEVILPLGPAESHLKLLKQSKALGVAMVINIELSLCGCQVEVPTTMANAIRTGSF